MIQIVATHGFDHCLQCHIAAFGMVQWLVKVPGPEPRDQRQIPLPKRGECGQRRTSVIALISCGPVVLIEGLDDVTVLRKSLPQPERKYNLAVGEMTEYVPDAPLAWSGSGVEFVSPERRDKTLEPRRCGPRHRKRISVA